MSQVYPITIKGHTFLYKGATRYDLTYCKGAAHNNLFVYFELLIKRCLLEPKVNFGTCEEDSLNLDDLPFIPGDIAFLARQIESASGFRGDDFARKLSKQAEEYSDSESGKLDLLVMMAFPGTTITELLTMDSSDLFKLYQQAQIAAPIMGFDPKIILDPEGWLEDQKEAKRKARIEALQQNALSTLGQTTRSSNMRVEETKTYSVK